MKPLGCPDTHKLLQLKLVICCTAHLPGAACQGGVRAQRGQRVLGQQLVLLAPAQQPAHQRLPQACHQRRRAATLHCCCRHTCLSAAFLPAI